MLKVAVVGVNTIGTTHCTMYKADPLAELVAVCDILPDRAEAAAQQFGAKPYTSLAELLATEQIDVVSVATAGEENGGHHYEPTMQALRAQKHVLCEKPLSNNIEHAREMVAEAKRQGVRLGVDLNHRFVPAADRAKRFITEGQLGEPLFVNMNLWIRNPNESSPWFHLRALHPHSIDVMRFYCGPINAVQAFCTKAPGRNIWSTASINMRFASGAVGHLTGSYDSSMMHPIERCEVGGAKGRFVLENVYERLTFYPHDSLEKTVIDNPIFGGTGSFQDTFKIRLHRFLEQIEAGDPDEKFEGSGADGLAAQEVIEAAIRSWENGTVEEVAG